MNNNWKHTSYELSSRLEKLGVPQGKSEIVWYQNGGEARLIRRIDLVDPMSNNSIDAYDTAELGKMLPEYVGDWFLEMYKDSSNLDGEDWFLVRYTNDQLIKHGINHPYEAEARGLMIEFLIKNNHIKVEDITL